MVHRALFLLLALLALAAPLARAEGNADCLECHDEDVNEKKFLLSAHKEQECVFCHQDVELNEEFEHATPVAPVDCTECHEAEAEHYAKSIHGKKLADGDEMAPHCWDCHGSHYVRPPSDPASPTNFFNIAITCGNCHREGSPVSRSHKMRQTSILRNYSMSLHANGVYQKGLVGAAVCTSCHSAHDILPSTDPASTVNPDHVVETCRKCHGRIEDVHQKVIEGRLWEEEPGRIPICVDCHAPHEQRLKRDIEREEVDKNRAYNDKCLSCHARDDYRAKTMVRDGVEISLYVDRAAYEGSAHGRAGRACSQCHTDVTGLPQERACETVQQKVDCATCHAEVVQLYRESTHGAKAAEGDADAPTCLDCHDKHAEMSHTLPASPTFSRNVPELCARCHRQGEKAAVRIQSEVPIVDSYLMSIHGKGLKESGLLVTATCVNCHTAHHELPPEDPRSSVHETHVADTCGQCHLGIEEEFRTSIHWPGKAKTDRKLPSCKDCHTSHQIRRADQADFRLLMINQCGTCHEEETKTFFESTVHGQSSQLGSARSAKCYDCHGSHQILPPDDPASTLSTTNVVKTCGQCHTGAHRQFAGYLTHATHHDPKKYPWLFWAFWGMTALLIGTLAVALVHTSAWLVRLWLTKEEWRPHKALPKPKKGDKLYRRFDRYQRTQHLLMLLSFFVLAITGMTLKFSYADWAKALSSVVGFDAMSTLHRFGAVVLFGVFLTHLEYVRRKRKRLGLTWKEMLAGPTSIVINKRDLKEAGQAIKWFFGRGPRPKFGRYTYWEKFDYLAVFWGVAVIGLTGLMRWFPEIFTHFIPGWFINVAAIIHSDEALLAVGFIFTIHFFNTHFRPDKFPMDPVIFTGRVSLEELKYDKPREYERLVASGELDKDMVDPFPDGVVTASRIFGFIALGIGLVLIAVIIYSMIWVYT